MWLNLIRVKVFVWWMNSIRVRACVGGCRRRRQHQEKEDGRRTALLQKPTKDGGVGGGGSIKMSECGGGTLKSGTGGSAGPRSALVNGGSPAAEPLMGRSPWLPQLTPGAGDDVTASTCSTFKRPQPSPAVWLTSSQQNPLRYHSFEVGGDQM